jgi:hypothetical protein
MKPQVPDIAVRVLPAGLPVLVRDLSFESNRPVIDPARLFFRETKPTFSVPEITARGKHDSWGPFTLEHRIFYLWQGDGSLAVYAYLFDGSHAAGRAYGCLYVGCVAPKDWTLGGVK